MLAVVIVVMITVAVSHWLVEPFVRLASPSLTLSWVGWALLAAGLWLFSGRVR
jgi:hypothetical protein